MGDTREGEKLSRLQRAISQRPAGTVLLLGRYSNPNRISLPALDAAFALLALSGDYTHSHSYGPAIRKTGFCGGGCLSRGIGARGLAGGTRFSVYLAVGGSMMSNPPAS